MDPLMKLKDSTRNHDEVAMEHWCGRDWRNSIELYVPQL